MTKGLRQKGRNQAGRPVSVDVTGQAEGVSVNLDVLMVHKLAVQGNSGCGKSWLLRTLLEGTNGQVQHVVIDPEGEYATLREISDSYDILGVQGQIYR